jgi:hypothetical protein
MSKTATYSLIASYTVTGSAVANYTFSSIPQTFTDLVLVSFARTTDTASGNDLKGNFNSDTGTNYSNTQMYGDGSTAVSTRQSNASWVKIGLTSGSSLASGTFANGTAHILDYANTTTYKTCLVRRDLTALYTVATVNLWRNTAAITSLTIAAQVGNMDIGTTLKLYGIQAGNA